MKTVIKNRYTILRAIGAGGMSEVFLAHDELLDRNVAVKRLRDQFVSDKILLSQFNREAKSAAQLVHPNIIGIYDVIDDGADQYIVMEYVAGKTLKALMEDYRIEPKAALQITMQLASALSQAHKRNIIHCDIKPQNILMDDSMTPKIADFGIAKMVTGQTMVFNGSNVMGSVHYISPEQASGEPVTAASDIYSLGIVLFEMLTGKVPFTADTPVAVAMMQVDKPVPLLSEFIEKVPDGVQTILDRMVAKRPGDRYAKADDLVRDLEQVISNGEVGENGNETVTDETIVLPPVKKGKDKGKIIAVSVNRRAMVEKAKDWKERINNHKFTFNNYVVILTVFVCFISLVAHFFLQRGNVIIEVPSVVNMKVEEAAKYLGDRDYKVEYEEENTENDKVGLVVRQIPPAGEKRRRGSTVKIVFSVGAQKHTMPDIVDMSLVKAQQTLEEIGLRIGKIERKYNGRYRIGAIIEQVPGPGEKVGEGTLVDIIVNEGDKKLPDLVGMQLSVAEKTIRQMGLRVGEVRRVNSMDTKNTVTATFPEAGMMLPGYYPVRLTVSDGADSSVVGAVYEYVVPGLSSDKHRIQIYKIDRKGRNLIYSSTESGGKVIRQTIDSSGGQVRIVVYCDGQQVEENMF